MAIAHVNEAGANINGSSGTVTLGFTTGVGHLLLLTMNFDSGGTAPAATGGGTWTVVAGPTSGPGICSVLLSCICTTAVTSVGVSLTGTILLCEVADFSGVASATPDLTGTNAGVSSSMIAPSLGTPAVSNELFWASATASAGDITGTSPTNSFTPSLGNSAGQQQCTAYRISTDAAAHTTTYPLLGSVSWAEVMVSFEPAGAVASTQGILAAI